MKLNLHKKYTRIFFHRSFVFLLWNWQLCTRQPLQYPISFFWTFFFQAISSTFPLSLFHCALPRSNFPAILPPFCDQFHFCLSSSSTLLEAHTLSSSLFVCISSIPSLSRRSLFSSQLSSLILLTFCRWWEYKLFFCAFIGFLYMSESEGWWAWQGGHYSTKKDTVGIDW